MKNILTITSAQNPRLKEVIKLRDHAYRQQMGLTIVEGFRELTCAIKAKVTCESVFFVSDRLDSKQEILLKKLQQDNVQLNELGVKLFEKISFGNRKEGLLAVIRQPKLPLLEDLKEIKNPFYVIVQGVEKPGNLGAILRTCDAAGVDALFVCEAMTDVFNPNVIRASLGTVFFVNLLTTTSAQVLQFLKQRQVSCVAAFPEAQQNYTKVDFTKKVTIVLGSEHQGLSDLWQKEVQQKISIPMRGQVDSLNLSTATAILLYEVVRQRSRNFN